MKFPDTEISLVGPTGRPQRWLVRCRPMKAGHHAETDWDRQVLTINSRRRKVSELRLTMIHEAVHITVGQHADERLAENIEDNAKQLINTLGIE